MRSSSSGLGVAVGSSSLPPSSSSSSVSAVHAVSLDWHQSPEEQGILAHLIDQKTGARKQYGKKRALVGRTGASFFKKNRLLDLQYEFSSSGILERPLLPPTVQIVQFKLFLSGKAGVGKTSLVSYLSGNKNICMVPVVPSNKTSFVDVLPFQAVRRIGSPTKARPLACA